MIIMALGCHIKKYEWQHREHKSLDEADKKLKAIKWHWHNDRNQEGDNYQKYFSGKNISE